MHYENKKLHFARLILYPALETVLRIDLERTHFSISSSSASWIYPTCQYSGNKVVDILWCTCDVLHSVAFLYIPHHLHEGVSILICLCQTWLHPLDATWHMYLWGCLSCVSFATLLFLLYIILSKVSESKYLLWKWTIFYI